MFSSKANGFTADSKGKLIVSQRYHNKNIQWITKKNMRNHLTEHSTNFGTKCITNDEACYDASTGLACLLPY